MDLRSYLELFLFDPNKQRQKVGSLSGGERARVAIAKMLRGEANLLVLDEPTNDLDLPTLTALEGLLEDYEGSAIVVTHDRAFLDRVATAILAFESDRSQPGLSTVIRYAGGYEDYVAQRRQSRETGAGEAREEPEEREERVEGEERRKPESGSPGTAHAPEVVASAPSKRQAKRAPLLTYAERIEFEGIVSAVDEAEKRVAEIEALLGDPELYAKRGHEVAGLKARLIEAKDGAARLLERWEALEAKSGRPLT
jgi:ATP-binding cassette subfamily F protein uup